MSASDTDKKAVEQIRTKFVEFLGDQGYKIVENEWNEDTTSYIVVFRAEGATMMAIFDSDDAKFVQMLFPNFYSLDDDDEKFNSVFCINDVNRACKVAKMYLNKERNNVMASCEFLVSGEVDFGRYLSMLRNIADSFAQAMKTHARG